MTSSRSAARVSKVSASTTRYSWSWRLTCASLLATSATSSLKEDGSEGGQRPFVSPVLAAAVLWSTPPTRLSQGLYPRMQLAGTLS